jgi:hypothetical protein
MVSWQMVRESVVEAHSLRCEVQLLFQCGKETK